MTSISLGSAKAILARQAEALGGSWETGAGAESAWGIARYPYVELSEAGSISIRIWIDEREAILSVESASEFDEANLEIWGFREEVVEDIVNALARGDFVVLERYVQVNVGRKKVRLTKWPPGGRVPGVAR
jgi:hypothetical protein